MIPVKQVSLPSPLSDGNVLPCLTSVTCYFWGRVVMTSARVRVIRALTAVMYIFSFLQHLQFSPAFRRKPCFSVLKSLK